MIEMDCIWVNLKNVGPTVFKFISVYVALNLQMKDSCSANLGPVHTYPDTFESATFSFRIQKFPRPHVSDGIRIHPSTQGSSVLKFLQSMRRRAR